MMVGIVARRVKVRYMQLRMIVELLADRGIRCGRD
jgi:hypothetical protein